MDARKEPDQQGSWRKVKHRTLIRVRKLFEIEGRRMALIAISGRGQDRVERPEDFFPPWFLPIRHDDVFVVYVNLYAARIRDIEIAFSR